MDQSKRDEIFELAQVSNITLNGKPALLRGRLLAFPTVTSADNKAEFAWETVEWILSRGGRFKSSRF